MWRQNSQNFVIRESFVGRKVELLLPVRLCRWIRGLAGSLFWDPGGV